MLWGQINSQTALPSVCFVSFKHFSNPSSVFFYILMFDKQPVSGCVDGLAVGSAVEVCVADFVRAFDAQESSQ